MSEKRTPRGPVGRSMPGEKAKDFKGSMTKLIVYMKRYHTPLFFMFLFSSCSPTNKHCVPYILFFITFKF